MGDISDNNQCQESSEDSSSIASCSSLDLSEEEEEASSSNMNSFSSSSSSSNASSSNSDGPLYELSDLMAQLPIKRGLSKFYDGKSQSYTSLASVRSIGDLAKKTDYSHCKKKLKTCKSDEGIINSENNKTSSRPKASSIAKKTSTPSTRGTILASSSLGKSSTSITNTTPPIPALKTF